MKLAISMRENARWLLEWMVKFGMISCHKICALWVRLYNNPSKEHWFWGDPLVISRLQGAFSWFVQASGYDFGVHFPPHRMRKSPLGLWTLFGLGILSTFICYCSWEKEHTNASSSEGILSFPRHPGPPPEVRYLDPQNIPKTPSEDVFGCLGFTIFEPAKSHTSSQWLVAFPFIRGWFYLSLIFKSLNKHLKGVSSTHYASQKLLVLLYRHRTNISHRKPVRAWRVSHIVTHMIIHF